MYAITKKKPEDVTFKVPGYAGHTELELSYEGGEDSVQVVFYVLGKPVEGGAVSLSALVAAVVAAQSVRDARMLEEDARRRADGARKEAEPAP